jgi:hypothetical protein
VLRGGKRSGQIRFGKIHRTRLRIKENIMNKIVRKQICECKNCGNEAEMIITCSLEDAHEHAEKTLEPDKTASKEPKHKVKGSATCSHCGNEADMWIDL